MKQVQETEILIGDMKKYLPIPARIKKKPYQYLMQQEGTNPNLKQEVTIVDVLDSGDMGGILALLRKVKIKQS